MERMKNFLPFLGMMVVILIQTSNQVVSKAAMSDGMNKYVLIFYSYAFTFLLLLPFAFLLLRSECPPLSISSLCRFFLLAIFGCSAQILTYVGIDLSSPTLATALLNLIPAFVYVLALIFRMEVIHCRQLSSQAKVLGTAISIGGAFVVIFYKGPPIFKAHSSVSYSKLPSSPQSNWTLGGFFCATQAFIVSLWYIYQVSVIEAYPVIMVIIFFQKSFCTILSAPCALIAVTDPKAWVLRLDMGLVSILYQAAVYNLIGSSLNMWCVQKAGPLFCTMFKPVGIIFTVLMGALFLGDGLHLGSLVGSVIIMVGFYAVMWGNAKEQKNVEEGIENLESSCHNVPLLQNRT